MDERVEILLKEYDVMLNEIRLYMSTTDSEKEQA